jgi:glycopeptide antibiotics resistance protein
MRDLIWTIIGIWFVYNIYRFLTFQKNKNFQSNVPSSSVKPETNSDLSNKGEYIDFEEIKD